MKTEQAPHEKLTDDQVEEVINEIFKRMDEMIHSTVMESNKIVHMLPKEGAEDPNLKNASLNIHNLLYSFKEDFLKKFEQVENLSTKLKKHTSPEKFSVMKVSVGELADLMAYPEEKKGEYR